MEGRDTNNQPVTVNVNVPNQSSVVHLNQNKKPHIVIRLLWIFFIGWWLSGIFYFVGAILTLLIITSPLGMVVLQKMGWAFSLYEESKDITIVNHGGMTTVTDSSQETWTSFLIRYIYFIFIGWWAGIICWGIASLFGLTIIGLPVTILIMDRLGKVMTLKS
tara:strand:+ start:39 stop:524 length:486 start_codon:yes stop_codon:yes gene_type:complete